MSNRVLLADDDSAIRLVLQQALTREGFQVRATGNVATLSKWAQEGEGDLIVTDVYMGDSCVFDALPAIRAQRPQLPIIVMSAQSTVQTAMTATGAGAYDYLPKPFDLDELLGMARRALAQNPGARARAAAVQAEKDARLSMVGRSSVMQDLYRTMARAAACDLPILIEGEIGVGKERIARAIHAHGRRQRGPFFVASLAGDGQCFDKAASWLAAASGGVLFLDGVHELDHAGQLRLLSFIDAVERDRPDCRIISARTVLHADSDTLMRAQLALRLGVLKITAPTLRQRREDLGELARALLAQARADGLSEKVLDPSAVEALQAYDWPGNVRELWNLVRRLSVLRSDKIITRQDVEAELQGPTPSPPGAPRAGDFDALLSERIDDELKASPLQPGLFDRMLAQVERPLIEKTLKATRGNQIKAAAILGINRNTLRKKILSLGVVAGKAD